MNGEIKAKRKGLVRTPQLYEAICEMLIDSGVLQIDWVDEDAETRIYSWTLNEQDAVEPKRGFVMTQKAWFCGACGFRLNRAGRFCSKCGR